MRNDPHFSDAEKVSVNYRMSHAFVQWCDDGDQSDYVDLARRLNACAIHHTNGLRKRESA